MSFLDIKDPTERATLVKEYVTAVKTGKQRNMVNREMKLAIENELQIATKQAADETRKELEPKKKRLTDIDEALNRTTVSKMDNLVWETK